VALPAPGVPVLGTVVDEEKHAGSRQAVDEAVQERLSLAIDPVKVLEEDEHRLDLALADQEALDRIQCLLATLGRIESIPRRVVDRDSEEPEQRGEIGLEGAVEEQELAGDLVADLADVIPGLYLEVGAEQLDDGSEPRGLAIVHRGGLEGEAPRAWWAGMTSQESRDLPTPGSPTMATTCPWPARTCSRALSSASISASRPTNLVRPRPRTLEGEIAGGPLLSA
jgi:hypothetical protein